MTEREYHHEREVPAADQRQVYHRTEPLPAAPGEATREVVRERVVEGPGGSYASAERVVIPGEAEQRAATATRIKQIISFVFGAVAVLLGVRFVLLLLGASQASPFVQAVYGLSGVFAMPFFGIFGEPSFNSSVLEWASLVGIVVYLLVAWGLSKLVDVTYAPPAR